MRIIIGALSCWKYPERQERCLSTWIREGYRYTHLLSETTSFDHHEIVRSVLLIGEPTIPSPRIIGKNYLLLPVPNDYPSLPQRTRAFCQWALGQDDWDYLFKCDDDTYVSMSRLIQYPLTADYIGSEWSPGVGYASGGAGYFLSRRAAQIVAEHMTQQIGDEDVLVRDTLVAHGIPFTQDQRFVAFGNNLHRPRVDNDLITLHGVQADLFYKSHEEAR